MQSKSELKKLVQGFFFLLFRHPLNSELLFQWFMRTGRSGHILCSVKQGRSSSVRPLDVMFGFMKEKISCHQSIEDNQCSKVLIVHLPSVKSEPRHLFIKTVSLCSTRKVSNYVYNGWHLEVQRDVFVWQESWNQEMGFSIKKKNHTYIENYLATPFTSSIL